MSGRRKPKKVEAIFELREAVEEKVRAEIAYESAPVSHEAQGDLLEAQLDVEAKTQDAIEACHECSHPHAPSEPHRAEIANHESSRVAERRGNVLAVDFRSEKDRSG